MPNGGDSEPVLFGRWQEAHQRLEDRVHDLEEDVDSIRDALRRRGDRQWMLVMAALTGLALPLLVAIVIFLTNIRR